MIERYSDKEISRIWSDEHKVFLWDQLELAVIKAREDLKEIPDGTHAEIAKVLVQFPVDQAWWKKREEETKHDLNAYIDERLRHLDQKYHQHFHAGMTSYDTEELPFQLRLLGSMELVQRYCFDLMVALESLAHEHRQTPMLGRTHGQEAKLQSFGKRVLTWIAQLQIDLQFIRQAAAQLKQSKLSGAIGNYQGLDEKLELKALSSFGFTPYYGATQIMPRNIHSALADALARLCLSIAKIAEDIRLNARSGLPLVREPFGKNQKGSSAMPHKKNTITTEQLIGMARMANTKALALRENIITWEERAIEQSCVERVEWPDLLHVTCHMLKSLTRVMKGLVVYKQNMLKEIEDSLGTYASEDAKDYLKKHGEPHGLTHEDAYRIVQLACFNLFEGGYLRESSKQIKLDGILLNGALKVHPELSASEEQVCGWNQTLRQIFQQDEDHGFLRIFTIVYQLRGEEILFAMIGGKRDPLT